MTDGAHWLRRRLTYANVMATLGVFLAVSGGVAFALAKNSIKSKHIKDGQVRSVDVRDGDLTGADVADGSLGGNEIADGSLGGADVAGLTGDDVTDESLGSADVAGLTGADVADESLGGADVAGLTGEDIANGSLGSADIADLTGDDVTDESLGSADVAGLTGADVTDGSLGAEDLAAGTVGARAYGRVDNAGDVTRSKNVVGATNPATGVYCITLAASIDPATAVLIATPDFQEGSTNTTLEIAPVISWHSGRPNCPAGTMQVATMVYDGDSTDNDNGGGDTAGDELKFDDEPFSFMVP